MKLPEWFKKKDGECQSGRGIKPHGFIERNLARFASIIKEVFTTEEYASRGGLLQRLDGRAKLTGFFLLLAAGAMTGSALFLFGVLVVIAVLASVSRVGIAPVAKRVFPSLVFTFFLVLPVTVNAVTPGKELFGYNGFAVTREGLLTGGFFLLRVVVMLSLTALLALTTRQSDFFKGLGRLIPAFFVTALFFTFRYAVILIKTAEDATMARKSRSIGRAGVTESQSWFASRAALILKRSFSMADEVNMAMISRGFAGKVRTPPAGALGARDYLWIGFSSFVLFLSIGT